jgi:hypothetical protein
VAVMNNSVIWNITLCSPLEVNQRLGETCRLHLLHAGMLLGLFLDPEHGMTCSSKTSANFQHTIWHYLSEDRTLISYINYSIRLKVIVALIPHLLGCDAV